MQCYACELWPEALNNFGSALESLLRVRFGSGGVLKSLINKFDTDAFFNSIKLHTETGPQCMTCYADRVRILRNSVHPDCWKKAIKEDVDNSKILVVMLYHALIVCGADRVADFAEAPEDTLKRLEASSIMSL